MQHWSCLLFAKTNNVAQNNFCACFQWWPSPPDRFLLFQRWLTAPASPPLDTLQGYSSMQLWLGISDWSGLNSLKIIVWLETDLENVFFTYIHCTRWWLHNDISLNGSGSRTIFSSHYPLVVPVSSFFFCSHSSPVTILIQSFPAFYNRQESFVILGKVCLPFTSLPRALCSCFPQVSWPPRSLSWCLLLRRPELTQPLTTLVSNSLGAATTTKNLEKHKFGAIKDYIFIHYI